LQRAETQWLQEEEENEESERDTQSIDRFELKRETEKTIKQDMNVSAGLTVTGGLLWSNVNGHLDKGDMIETGGVHNGCKTTQLRQRI
jgi:hypothetical protein